MEPRGIHHVGVTVRDLDRSLDFYRDILGAEPDFIQRVRSSPQRDAALGVQDAEVTIAFFHIGAVRLELLEYHNSDRDVSYRLRNCDVGSSHVCFEVDDIHTAYEELSVQGVDFYSEPLMIDEGPLTGYTFCYLSDPDGVTLELFQTPAVTDSRRATG